MNEKNYEAIIEAILFTMGESVELDKIAAAIELDKKETKAIIEKMMKHYENPSIGVKIIELDDAYQMCTKSEMYEYLIKIARQPKRHVLTDVLLETLSIIADHQGGDREDPRCFLRSRGEQAGGIQSGMRAWQTGCTGAPAALRNDGRVPTKLWGTVNRRTPGIKSGAGGGI
mgnify:CR=1 FL=1